MAVSSALMVLLFSLVLCAQALKHRSPLGRRSKRETTASSMFSFFSSLETKWKNSTKEQMLQLEAKMEGEMEEKLQDMEEKLQDMEEKLQGVQDGMQRLESMMNVMTEKMAQMVEAKANATEESAASLEATKTEPQSSSATCQYQYQYQFERASSRSSGEQQRVAKLESELTMLQEKVSALDKHLQNNDVSVESLQNASTMAMEGVVHSMTELVAASEQNLKSTMENATKLFHDTAVSMMNGSLFASMMSDLEIRLFARAEHNAVVFNASISRVEETAQELATRMSAVEDKLDNATSLHVEERENARSRGEDVQRKIESIKNHTTDMTGRLWYKKTCQDYYNSGQRTSGVYGLQLEFLGRPIIVYCEMSNGAGWVVFQRRMDGSVDFYRNWTSYEDGFGDLNGEFWLGNRNIHRLTSAGLTQLRVDLQAWNGSTAFASYSNFSVGDASTYYTLSVSGYSGTAGDSLPHSNGRKFTTFDQDHDAWDGVNCAEHDKAAWWFQRCTDANLNGLYGTASSIGYVYVRWEHWLRGQALQRSELKLK